MRLRVVEERQDDIAAAFRHRYGRVQQRAGKYHPCPTSGLVAMGIVLGKEDMPAPVFRVTDSANCRKATFGAELSRWRRK
jgi:hypothetical protein